MKQQSYSRTGSARVFRRECGRELVNQLNLDEVTTPKKLRANHDRTACRPVLRYPHNRQPLCFASEDSTLFCWLHMPWNLQAGDFGMVLCPPLGIDYVNTYPALRHLADRLAARGIPVLRSDYSGTGNSSGFDFDGERQTLDS